MLLVMPVIASSAGLIPCGETTRYKKGDIIAPAVTKKVNVTGYGGNTNTTQTITPARIAEYDMTLVSNPCDFNDAMELINRLINFVLFTLTIPLVTIMFIYAGVKLIFSGGEAAARTKAKGVFFNAVIGLVIAFTGFLVIRVILSILGYDGAWIGFK